MRTLKSITLLLAALIALPVLTGCGAKVTVEPACVGKVFSSSGYEQGLKMPSSFRLPFAGFGAPPKLVVAEVSDQNVEETMQVYMPGDKMNLTFDIRGTASVKSNDVAINSVFERVTPAPDPGQNNDKMWIDFDRIYATYAQQVLRTVGRHIVTKYAIEQVVSSQDPISKEILTEVNAALAETPIEFKMLALANVQPPEVIVKAQEKAKEREIAIQQAEADKLVALTQAEAALEVAKKQQQVDLLEAETQVLVEERLSRVVSPAYTTQRGLKVLEKLGENGNLILMMPYDAFRNPALLIGGTNQALQMKAGDGK